MIPTVTVAQMREVDRLMMEEMEINLLQMMENAGRALAVEARLLMGGDARRKRVVTLAGPGGNGGGGLTAARRLATWGAEVSVFLGGARAAFQGVKGHQLDILDHLDLPVHDSIEPAGVDRALAAADVVLDALVGYSLHGALHGPIASLIRKANASQRPIIALDIPSGLDGDTGEAYEPTIQATRTLTLALPKAGLLKPAAPATWETCSWLTFQCPIWSTGAWDWRSDRSSPKPMSSRSEQTRKEGPRPATASRAL
jgi:NAD(P)H-hydrate epimerase